MFRIITLGAALLGAGCAIAHVSLAEPSAPAGSYHVAFFRVSHGCEGSPTVSLRVEVPAVVMTARPKPKPGWTVAVEKAPLAAPVRSEGGQLVHDRVMAVTWTGRLEADQFDQFGMLVKLPDTPGPLYFPAIQRCEKGEARWTTIPAAGQPHGATPAPMLAVLPGHASAVDHMKM